MWATVSFHATFDIELILKCLILEIFMKTTGKIQGLRPTFISTRGRHLERPASIPPRVGN